ncbi:hypothetical protein LSH36_501g02011 [Paralvinella palmiformis]|uniref:Uncharacterized protein n=1 Tax=Paralvinella palmiformis TaxID=53620 RepID=A0AAD9J829_9ANNE|nr:hypothetical protein LSH36_501g02011 [Paralvinella palmiformis]
MLHNTTQHNTTH